MTSVRPVAHDDDDVVPSLRNGVRHPVNYYETSQRLIEDDTRNVLLAPTASEPVNCRHVDGLDLLH